MRFDLDEDQRLLASALARWTAEQVRPHCAAWDAALPSRLSRELAELGAFGVAVDAAAGGAGMDGASWALCVETLAMAHGALAAQCVVQHAVLAGFAHLQGVAARRDELLSGERLAGWGPAGGPILGGGPGGVVVVTEGSEARAVESAPEQGSPLPAPLGLRGVPWGSVPVDIASHAAQPVGAGLDWLRVGFAALCVGLGQEAVDRAAAYAKERRQFNQPIAEFQAVQFKLADAATAVSAARWLVYRAASQLTTTRSAALAGMAYVQAARAAEVAADHAVQLHGGNGYVREYEIERIYRDVQVCRATLGGTRGARQLIAASLLGEV